MNGYTVLLALMLSGFFAVACMRASSPQAGQGGAGVVESTKDLLRFPGRLERLRRSRWQWFAMVALMVVLRLQQQLPLVLELMAALQFLLFLAVPTRNATPRTERRRALSQ
jgi:hypothetical protein